MLRILYSFCITLVFLTCSHSALAVNNPLSEDISHLTLFDGNSLDQWKETEFSGQGQVSIQDKQLVLGIGKDMTGVTWTGPVIPWNYEIELYAKRLEGSDFFCGLTFPVGDMFCSLICGGWGGNLVGLSCLDYQDAANNVTGKGVPMENNRWYRIRMRVTKHVLKAWINDQLVIDINTNDYRYTVRYEVQPSRPLGIATWKTSAAIRDISMRRVKAHKRYEPTYSYITEQVQGWTVHTSYALDSNHPDLTQQVTQDLNARLYLVTQQLPQSVLAQLQKIPLWLEYGDSMNPGIHYLDDPAWITEYELNPEKLNTIEINATSFVTQAKANPALLVKSMAQYGSDQCLNDSQHQAIQTVYEKAKQSGVYNKVLFNNGQTAPHPGLQNPKAYFAEACASYFTTNHCYPFVKAELKQHDPAIFALLEKLCNQ